MTKTELLANLRLEKRALDARVHELSKVIDMDWSQLRSHGYTSEHLELLFQQFAAMSKYQTLLAQRIALLIAEVYRDERGE